MMSLLGGKKLTSSHITKLVSPIQANPLTSIFRGTSYSIFKANYSTTSQSYSLNVNSNSRRLNKTALCRFSEGRFNKKTEKGRYSNFYWTSRRGFFGKQNDSKKDYYKILGLNKNASKSEIKSSFFKLAKEWHPDRNKSPGAKEKFSEISEAYETLGDEGKKRVYDSTGMTGDQQNQQQEYNKSWGGGQGAGGNPFENMFRGGNTGNQGGRGFEEDIKGFWEDLENMFEGRSQESKKGRDILTNIEISFMEAINGTQKTVAFDRTAVCSTCNGSKARPGTGQTKCSTCGGSGKVVYRQGFMTIAMECTACGGNGTVIKNPCNSCHGKGSTNSKVTETVNIPKGVNQGVKLRVARKGHYSTGGQNGDLFINVKIRPHPYFKREEYDIHTVNEISISQAVLGAKIKVKTISGDAMITVDPGTNDGDVKKLNNYGVPKLNSNANQRGHHFIKFKIIIPNRLNSEQKRLFEDLSGVEEKPREMKYDD